MIDLHTHTNNSDGTQTVSELLTKAEQAGLKYLSITDHDSISAYKDLEDQETRKLFSGKIVRGTEIYFKIGDVFNEVLGYGINIEKIKTDKIFDIQLRQSQELGFLRETYQKFKEHGFTLSPLEVIEDSMSGYGFFGAGAVYEDLKKHPENQELLDKNNVKNILDYYHVWVDNKESGFFVDTLQYKPSLDYVSKLIRDAGGLVFMAHIFRKNPNEAKMLLDYAISKNLIDGIEVYYKDFTTEQIEYLKQFCKEHNLLMSGGTDSHHIPNKVGVVQQEQTPIPYEIARPWLDTIETI